jgi:chromosome partitioning protein
MIKDSAYKRATGKTSVPLTTADFFSPSKEATRNRFVGTVYSTVRLSKQSRVLNRTRNRDKTEKGVPMAHIYSICNAKGGCAKTTTAINLGAALAEQGHSVLLIDNDPERHLSNALGFPAGKAKYTLASLMNAVLNETDIETMLGESILATGNLACITSNQTLAGVAARLAVKQGTALPFGDEGNIKSEFVLKAVTDALDGSFEYILIDCGPSTDLLTVNALVASDRVIIPVQAHYLSEDGLDSFIEIVGRVRRKLNPDLKVGGILITMYQGATNLCRSVREDIMQRFGEEYRVFAGPIPHSIKAAESPAYGKTILDHDPAGAAAAGYREMAREVLMNG